MLIGSQATDRFGVISPSSVIVSGSTENQLFVQDSFGALFPGNETEKWANYVGQNIYVHSPDYTVGAECVLQSIDDVNNYLLHTSNLPFTPEPGYIIDIAFYPDSADPTLDSLYKISHCFLDATVSVVTGIDDYNFTVSSGDIGKFFKGSTVRVHSEDYTSDSGELTVQAITGDQIEVSATMGFTPTAYVAAVVASLSCVLIDCPSWVSIVFA